MFSDAVSNSDNSASNDNLAMGSKGCGSVASLRQYPGIGMQQLWESTINLSQNSRCPDGDSRPLPLAYKAGVLTDCL